MTNKLGKILGVHFLIMLVYLSIGIFSDSSYRSIICIPLHTGLCLFVSAVLYFLALFEKEDKQVTLFYAKSHLLSAIVVGIIGYSVCSTIIAPNFPH